MSKNKDLTWDEKKIKDLIRERNYDPSVIPDDVSVKINKKITLDDEILEMIWLIKKKKKKLRGEKPVIKLALRFFLNHMED